MFRNARHRLTMRNTRIQMRRMEDRNSGRQGAGGTGGACVWVLLAGASMSVLAAVAAGIRWWG